MADRNACGFLIQCLQHLCPKLAPQIIPAGEVNSREIIEALQCEVMKSRKPSTQVSFCELCGRARGDEDGEATENMGAGRVLRWNIDLAKKCLKITGLQLVCQDCEVLLNLKKLLTLFGTPEEKADRTKLYLLACHFSQINGHNSESGEEDVNLLEQAVAAAHALLVLTKNIPGITVHGPDQQIISLDSCHEVVESFFEKEKTSLSQSTKKVKRKKHRKQDSVGQMDDEEVLQDLHRVPTKTPKKAKTANKADSGLRNGHPSESISEEAIDLETTKATKSIKKKKKKKEQQSLSEKKPRKLSSEVNQKMKKKRRSVPVMTSGMRDYRD